MAIYLRLRMSWTLEKNFLSSRLHQLLNTIEVKGVVILGCRYNS